MSVDAVLHDSMRGAEQPPSTWRLDIQGVRGFAVLIVVLYHCNVLPGGFIGVDIFFVLSGFLITSVLLQPSDFGIGASLVTFYERRIRRLLPASLLVIASTVAAANFVFTPLDWSEVVADGRWATGFAGNIRMAETQADYLRASVPPSPLQHFWSLGVEEQFYAMWPLIVLVLRRSRRALIAAAAVLVVGSMWISFRAGLSVEWRFYGLPSRTWQLVAGAALAIVGVRPLSAAVREAVAIASALAIVVSVLLAGGRTLWPDSLTIVVSLATLGLISSDGNRIPALLLSVRPLTWLGDRSYSWYLVHFPPLILVEEARGSLSTIAAIAISVATLGVAHLLYEFIENPIRRGRRTVPGFVLATGVAATAMLLVSLPVVERLAISSPTGEQDQESVADLVAGTSLAARQAELDDAADLEIVPAGLQPALAKARTDQPSVYSSGCHASFEAVEAAACRLVGGPESGPVVLVYGDSHAAQWTPALIEIAQVEGWTLFSLTKSGCPVSDAIPFNPQRDRSYTECPLWKQSALAEIERLQPGIVLVATSGRYLGEDPTVDLTAREWESALEASLSTIAASTGADVAVLLDTPLPVGDVPSCLSAHLQTATACVRDAPESDSSSYNSLERRAADAAGVATISTLDLLCGQRRCPVVVGEVLVYRDDNHLTTVYARRSSGQLLVNMRSAGLFTHTASAD